MQTVPEPIKVLRQERNPLPLKKESKRDKNAKEVKKCQKATMTTMQTSVIQTTMHIGRVVVTMSAPKMMTKMTKK